MPVLCPTLPTGPLRMQTEQNVEDLCNSLRLKDISSFQGVVCFARVIGIRTLDRKVEMPPLKEVQAVTGYIRGRRYGSGLQERLPRIHR